MSALSRILEHPAARHVARAATLAWMALIFGLSSVPGSAVPGRFGSLAHFLEYAVLGALLYLASRRRPMDAGSVAAAVLIAAAYALSDEFHQSFVPGRTPDIADWGVDVLGALAGALATRALNAKRAA